MGPAPSYLQPFTSALPFRPKSPLALNSSPFFKAPTSLLVTPRLDWVSAGGSHCTPTPQILLLFFSRGVRALAVALADCDLTEDQGYAWVSVSWPPNVDGVSDHKSAHNHFGRQGPGMMFIVRMRHGGSERPELAKITQLVRKERGRWAGCWERWGQTARGLCSQSACSHAGGESQWGSRGRPCVWHELLNHGRRRHSRFCLEVSRVTASQVTKGSRPLTEKA